MSDEQMIARAHIKRVLANLKDIPLTERQSLGISSLALLMEAVMSENPMAIQERARVTIGLLDPRG